MFYCHYSLIVVEYYRNSYLSYLDCPCLFLLGTNIHRVKLENILMYFYSVYTYISLIGLNLVGVVLLLMRSTSLLVEFTIHRCLS